MTSISPDAIEVDASSNSQVDADAASLRDVTTVAAVAGREEQGAFAESKAHGHGTPVKHAHVAAANDVATACVTSTEEEEEAPTPQTFPFRDSDGESASMSPAVQTDEDEDYQMAKALQASENVQEDHRRRLGVELPLARLIELGVAFERQPDGSDSCAIHSLNNIVQAELPPEAKELAAAAAVALAAAEEEGEDQEIDLPSSGPFGLADLQEAEAESKREESQGSFMPASVQHLSVLRRNSRELEKPMVPCQSDGPTQTGMFDVEAVKIAARKKGYEVIDIEPKPSWNNADAARYVTAATSQASSSKHRWFLGFIVYERIPGRAMHYYVIIHWPPREGETKDSWLILDSLDRGQNSPRNRRLSTEELVEHYNSCGEFFKSWLVRWYPVVNRCAAITCLQKTLSRSVAKLSGREELAELSLSENRAESTLDGATVRWNVGAAADELLQAVELVARELQVLRFAVSEQQARQQLEREGWDYERAVRAQAEWLLEQCCEVTGDARKIAPNSDASADSPPSHAIEKQFTFWGPIATYSALQHSDWDVRTAAQLLLLGSKAEAAGLKLCAGTAAGAAASEGCLEWLPEVAAALDAVEGDLDRSLAVLTLMHDRKSASTDAASGKMEGQDETVKHADHHLSETDCALVLEMVNFQTERARSLLAVRKRVPQAPLAVCAEALRRGDDNTPTACALLDEFQDRIKSVVSRTCDASRPRDEASALLQDSEIADVAAMALDAAEWNPAVAFFTAESFALGVCQVRRQLRSWELRTRAQAMEFFQSAEEGESSEQDVASALAVIDALDNMKRDGPSTATILKGLQQCEMNPGELATEIWRQTIGSAQQPRKKPVAESDRTRRPSKQSAKAASKAVSPDRMSDQLVPPRRSPRPSSGERAGKQLGPVLIPPPLTQQKGAPKGATASGTKTSKKGKDCVVM